jgi:hypothetical protein
MNLAPILISLILATGVIMGMYSFYNDISIGYHPGDSTEKGNFTQFNVTSNSVNSLMASMQNKTTDLTSKGILSLSGVYDASIIFIDAIGLIFQTPAILLGFIGGLVSNIPWLGGQNMWFITSIETIITIVIVMLVVAIIMKRFQSEI